MAGQPKQVQLDGATYTIAPLPALRAFALQARIAPALAEVVGAMGVLGADLTREDVAAVAPAAARFFAKLDPAALEAVTRELLSGATIDGLPLFTPDGGSQVFDARMQGRALDTWLLLGEAIKVNYPDFFTRLAGLAAPAQATPTAAEPAYAG